MIFWIWIWIGMKKTGFKIQIQNPILYMYMDCQSQSNPPNWIAIRIEQSSNLIQQYPGHCFGGNMSNLAQKSEKYVKVRKQEISQKKTLLIL